MLPLSRLDSTFGASSPRAELYIYLYVPRVVFVMPRVRIPETEKYNKAIGVLASRGFGFQTRDPDILIIGNRAVTVLADAGLIRKREEEPHGATNSGPASATT